MVDQGGDIFQNALYVEIIEPNSDLNDFQGILSINNQQINIMQTIWANSTLAIGESMGIAIYTGCQTKATLNTSTVSSKVSKFDKDNNYIVFYLLILLFSMSLSIVIFKNKFQPLPFLTEFVRFVILFSAMIPISLKVTIDFTRVMYINQINKDQNIEGSYLKNSSIPEELGKIQILLCDKTGTLTQNIMKVYLLKSFEFDFDIEKLQSFVLEILALKDIQKACRTQRQKEFMRFLEQIMVCHNVMPILENGSRVLQASSPDEIALLEFIEQCNYKLLQRTLDSLSYINPYGQTFKRQVVFQFPFSSEKKRMGIII